MLRFLSLLKPKKYIGIEIIANELRVWQRPLNKASVSLSALMVIAFPRDVMDESVIKNQDAVVATLKRMMLDLKVDKAYAMFAVPYQSVLAKKIILPCYLQEEACEAEIAMHLSEYFPSINEPLYFDFRMAKSETEGMKEIQLFAIRCRDVALWIDTLQCVGLSVNVIDIDLYAASRAVIWLLDQKKQVAGCVALLFFGRQVQGVVFNRQAVILIETLSTVWQASLEALLKIHSLISIDQWVVAFSETDCRVKNQDWQTVLKVKPIVFDSVPLVSVGLTLRGL